MSIIQASSSDKIIPSTVMINPAEAVTITASAINHVKQALQKRGGGKGIRLDVKTTGCSGKSYVVDYVDETRSDDFIFHGDDGIIICVAPHIFSLVKGTQIDYVRKGLNSSFVFHNPNVTGACGCGESFTV